MHDENIDPNAPDWCVVNIPEGDPFHGDPLYPTIVKLKDTINNTDIRVIVLSNYLTAHWCWCIDDQQFMVLTIDPPVEVP